jgi:hypothetical protein
MRRHPSYSPVQAKKTHVGEARGFILFAALASSDIRAGSVPRLTATVGGSLRRVLADSQARVGSNQIAEQARHPSALIMAGSIQRVGA